MSEETREKPAGCDEVQGKNHHEGNHNPEIQLQEARHSHEGIIIHPVVSGVPGMRVVLVYLQE